MDPQHLEDLAELAYKYREAREAFSKIDGRDMKAAEAANIAIVRAANKLLAFAAEGPA